VGEIAEMMLDGTLCQCCGVYLGNESNGDFPQYCSSCARDAREEARRDKGSRQKQRPTSAAQHVKAHVGRVR